MKTLMTMILLTISFNVLANTNVTTCRFDDLKVTVSNVTKDGFDIKSNDSRAHCIHDNKTN